ncbi:hypothetical protein RR42_s3016 [Cupriavidus basilensis]|uniref:Uncharacterized protein n=1 Tax=Cupriavidus basilensis TaxID=68895 RepID=A0A0C4YFL4_9BURK|nr:hypothetical protein RR42_s3016 [Cupriavidus basilensis]
MAGLVVRLSCLSPPVDGSMDRCFVGFAVAVRVALVVP